MGCPWARDGGGGGADPGAVCPTSDLPFTVENRSGVNPGRGRRTSTEGRDRGSGNISKDVRLDRGALVKMLEGEVRGAQSPRLFPTPPMGTPHKGSQVS